MIKSINLLDFFTLVTCLEYLITVFVNIKKKTFQVNNLQYYYTAEIFC